MVQIFVFVLIAVTLVLLSMFVDGVIELYKVEKEEKNHMSRDGLDGYLDKTFGFGKVKLYKTVLDSEGNLHYLVYLPKYEWFKAPEYQWFEVFATHTGYQHCECER
ncbi:MULTISPECIES: hypothetical protein [Bacillaceae]|uniref:hypothetical protein n=1 Tax=Bacillaceae TaxID=186817 RepID=UPI0011881BB3|nr:hypothetical protein [Bacillus sp. S3]QCJ44514.1 hypothetical protein FAY30_22810 [Bacillus sp. S3]